MEAHVKIKKNGIVWVMCSFRKEHSFYFLLSTFFVCRTLKSKRDAYVSHLNRIYRNNLDKVSVHNCFNTFSFYPN